MGLLGTKPREVNYFRRRIESTFLLPTGGRLPHKVCYQCDGPKKDTMAHAVKRSDLGPLAAPLAAVAGKRVRGRHPGRPTDRRGVRLDGMRRARRPRWSARHGAGAAVDHHAFSAAWVRHRQRGVHARNRGGLARRTAETTKGYLPLCISMDETLAKLLKRRQVYAASRMSQLRKSSSAASRFFTRSET